MAELVFLILGLIGLVIGTELVVRGALNIAEHYKISPLFMGLTVLAVGTDLPELMIDITAAFQRLAGIETSGLIIGETIGTCMAQIALGLGILGIFGTVVFTKRQVIRDALMMVGSVILLGLVGYDGVITRIEGLIMIFVYVIYFMELKREEQVFDKLKRAPTFYPGWDIVSLVGGFAIVIFCSTIVIDNALLLAKLWGVEQSLIGILLVGLGTSLPEISVAIGALIKQAPKLAIGNLIGSNIFDVLFTIGISTTIAETKFASALFRFDLTVLFIISTLVLFLIWRNMRLTKKEAMLLLTVYAAYVIVKLLGIGFAH